ncbi:MAG: Hpt domain-containing protein [Candidatus Omnitrophica bacterium]|nr:Hpt domain-containing protein [Candidatus Omnitrophota bacterium]
MNNDNTIDSLFKSNSIKDILQTNSKDLHCPLEVYIKIIHTALEEGFEDMLSLEKNIADNNCIQIEDVSHKIKGVFANLRLSMVSSPATQINNLAKHQGSIEEMRKFFSQTKAALEDLKSEIDSKPNNPVIN